MEEWKKKTLSLEVRENQLQRQAQELQQELDKLKAEKSSEYNVKVSKDPAPISLGAQLAREKRMLMSHKKGQKHPSETADKKENDNNGEKKVVHKDGSRVQLNRHLFKEISNLSPLVRQNSRRYVYPLHSPNHS